MLIPFVVLAAVTLTTLRPELVTPEPTTRSAQLLRALDQAEDDFASVQRELGLVGSAPLVGLEPERPVVRPASSKKSPVDKTSAKPRH
jgi:hypothetical protein